LNSIFADYSQYSDDWFIPFVGDDVVVASLSVSVIQKNKAALDTQKGANLGLKCVKMRLAPAGGSWALPQTL